MHIQTDTTGETNDERRVMRTKAKSYCMVGLHAVGSVKRSGVCPSVCRSARLSVAARVIAANCATVARPAGDVDRYSTAHSRSVCSGRMRAVPRCWRM